MVTNRSKAYPEGSNEVVIPDLVKDSRRREQAVLYSVLKVSKETKTAARKSCRSDESSSIAQW